MLHTAFMSNILANYLTALSIILPNILAVEGNIKYIGAGLASVGILGTGVGQGLIGQGACLAIGRNPEMAPKVTSTMIVSAGISESGAIYSLVIAILLIFVV
ncbi:ATP synthase F0 subunit C [Mycoplasma feriruminatoris]|uniref:ATP synthase subunit c n=1 Tax=Mycoplasma feriruminatoris TaxID=1179777 RepID=A0AAQ3DQT9_9MOLU|nr:ATP synthase F0 subunit C [Mycoplasma feriruminatoris]UKS54419.1 ATP synthase F0, C subunit [Mycoplasma feriruminatoris]WFQ90474.1 ATP synthase subunit c [Mycoplasma feriruminatoris]WFQ91297.1 ATP synthase subunit C [Mycoplasma feriruminatoris]WFQ93807.1 ATP synthase subunit C [Mycoplasma feriruminatoris]WFQ94643.1 ATP synthase subunit c [Mycoplasma feriruminatoris]